MKKILSLVIALGMIFALGNATFAAEEKKTTESVKEAEAPQKSKLVTFAGEVTAFDAKANTITVKGKKGEVTADVTADTKIMAGKEAKTLADVASGDKVTVKYIQQEGKNTVKSIGIKGAVKKKGKKGEMMEEMK